METADVSDVVQAVDGLKEPTSLALILPSLNTGGMERVMTLLANHFAEINNLKVTLVLLVKSPHFYPVAEAIKLVEPDFDYRKYPRLVFTVKTLFWLRQQLKSLQPAAVLSFGGRYNAFVLLAAMGLNLNIFVSDRSRPTISYGKLLDWLNPLMYRRARGIIAQTAVARQMAGKRTGHQNIRVIPNPIRCFTQFNNQKERIILNVGRFIPAKHQDWLVQYFKDLNTDNWQLVFLGEGASREVVKELAKNDKRIHFKDTVSEIDKYYAGAAIFAFTSTSEGFPNALGEAMAAGCACISFDCEAGPADLIDDGVNGFLVPVGNHALYKQRLQTLIDDEALRFEFGRKAQAKMKKLSIDVIARQYLDFILPNKIT